MAYIGYVPFEQIDPALQVDDRDNIIQIHGVHPRTIRQHHALYAELMRGHGPLSRRQREMIGVLVSGINDCHY